MVRNVIERDRGTAFLWRAWVYVWNPGLDQIPATRIYIGKSVEVERREYMAT